MLFALGFLAGITTSLLCMVLEIALFYRFSREGKGLIGRLPTIGKDTKPTVIDLGAETKMESKIDEMFGL